MKTHFKLETKVTLAIIIISIILSTMTVLTCCYQYATSFREHYIELAENLASTAASLLDPELIRPLRDEAVAIYNKNPAPDFDTEAEWEDYYAQYLPVMYGNQRESYDYILDTLDKFKEGNRLEYIYLSYLDPETKTALYLVDADDSDSSCPMGTWDIIFPENYDNMETPDQRITPFVNKSDEFGTLCSAGVSVQDENGEVIAHVFIDLSMNEIISEGIDFLFILMTMVFLFTAVIILLVNYWVRQVLVAPINSLAAATHSYVMDQERHEVTERSAISLLNIKTGDEIENLSSAIQMMEQDINHYVTSLTVITAEKERIGAELNVATNIQASMLPRLFPAFPERGEFDLYATMTPAKEVGGDFYDYFLIDGDHLCLSIADVSGKGVPAALFMVIAKTMLKNAAQSGLSPKDILEKVNNQLCENNEAGMFVTVWIGILEISTGKMICSNAGHEYPAIKRANGQFHLYKEKHGFVLAGLENYRYHEYELQLYPEDVLYVYTDGVAEGTNMQEELFGTDRMLLSLNREDTNDPERLLQNVAHDLADFVQDADQFDDITMLGFRFKSKHTRKKHQPSSLPTISNDQMKAM